MVGTFFFFSGWVYVYLSTGTCTSARPCTCMSWSATWLPNQDAFNVRTWVWIHRNRQPLGNFRHQICPHVHFDSWRRSCVRLSARVRRLVCVQAYVLKRKTASAILTLSTSALEFGLTEIDNSLTMSGINYDHMCIFIPGYIYSYV